MKRGILLILISFLCVGFLAAQSPDRRVSISVHGGAMQYNGDLGNGFYKFDQAFYGFGMLGLSYYLGTHFDIALMGSRGDVGHMSDIGHFSAHLTQANVQARFSFFKFFIKSN